MLKQHNPFPAYVALVAAAQRGLSWCAARVSPLWCGLALLGAALASRVYRLDAQSLWLDELNTWWLVQTTDWATLWDALWQSNSAYPLYHLLLKAWIAAAGDCEAALRLPSALIGAVAVTVVYFAACEIADDAAPGGVPRQRPRIAAGALVCGILCLVAPFAIWYAQEVKTYSLLFLSSAATVWLLLRTLRRGIERCGAYHWLAFGGVALVSLFVHRFAILLLLGCGFALVAAGGRARRARVLAGTVLVGLSVAIVEQMRHGLRYEDAIDGAHSAVGPLEAVHITFWRFALDRNPYDVAWLWLLPGAALALWGLLALLRDARRRRPAALALLCCGGIPALLFLVQLWWTRLYEPRYMMIIYPAWLLLLSYPLISGAPRRPGAPAAVLRWLAPLAVGLVSVIMLFRAPFGLWSGVPVKEQYREAVRLIAQRAHPDDAIILHPSYIRPAWRYYAPRSTPEALPEPISFEAFKQGQTAYSAKDWDTSREQQLQGHLRSFLLIAPFHARTVDRPPAPDDEYGLVGLYYQYSWEQHKWPCGTARFQGVHVLCQASPEPYGMNFETPGPAVAQPATFDDGIVLRGYTITPFNGLVRAGGTLPITLFWEVTRRPAVDYSVFLHLCRDCDQPPAASDDGPPLGGGVPTSAWLPGHPVHDERTIVLPDDLPAGRYTLLLGLYRPGDSTIGARLRVQGGAVIDENRVLLGTVEVAGGEQAGE